jgi:hypothetical protein
MSSEPLTSTNTVAETMTAADTAEKGLLIAVLLLVLLGVGGMMLMV